LALIYSITLFVNAALLFIIEPLVAKMILPFLGGSPAVWNTSLLFFQACLLAGYAYAHFGSAWLGTRRHALVHLNLLLAGLLLLPIVLPTHWFGDASANPINLLLGVLAVSIGLPFLVLSAGAPLLQKWFAQSNHPAARDPYFLYAASNAGSLIGLLAYPFVLEPHLPVTEQNQFWLLGYLVLLTLVALCVLFYLRPFSSTRDENGAPRRAAEEERDSDAAKPTAARRLRWVLWSFAPSSLLLGVTSYITTDIASAPFLWVVPLAAYLLSFILAFSRSAWTTHPIVLRCQAFFLVAGAVTIFLHANEPDELLLPLHLAGFFVTALVCHGRLAQDRPSVKHLTEYFLWLSLGGVLGGVFNALIAPIVFNHVIEYPLVLALAAWMRPGTQPRRSSGMERLGWLVPPAMIAAIVLIAAGLKQQGILPPANDRLLIAGLTGLFLLKIALRPRQFGPGLLLLVALSLWYPTPMGKILYSDRSFFGYYRAAADADGKRTVLFQGTTIHGAQSAERETKLVPLAYYHRTGPAGQVLVSPSQQGKRQIAVVGLGTGALACHGTHEQAFTFYEIDPLVEKIARDDRLFTYLRDCPPRISVVIGDARISLSKAANHSYDVFILDAFSSDVVPVHLLTREAVELYLAKTAPDGMLLFHVSNRVMDLAPVLDRLAAELGLAAYIQNDLQINPEEWAEGKSPSRWILMARQAKFVAPVLANGRWEPLLGGLGGDLWTDDYSDLLKVIRWR